MQKKPLVSIVLPVFNAQTHASEAIKSILRQTYSNFELIIIEDASTDKTRKVVREYTDTRVRFLANTDHLGVTKSLNRGLEATKGEYIARMDADDIALPTRLETQVKFLENHPEIGVVGTGVELIDAKGKRIGIKGFDQTHAQLKNTLLRRNPLIHPTVMFRRILIEDYGGYDEVLDGAEDYDLWLRLAKHTYIVNLPDLLLKYRIHQESVSYEYSDRLDTAFIKARWKSIWYYGYPVWHLIFMIKPIVSLFIPVAVKQKLYQLFYGYK